MHAPHDPPAGRRRKLPPAPSQPDDVFAGYLRDISQYDMITREQEYALRDRALAGDLEARDALVMANVRLGIAIAKKWRRPGVSDEDLVQEANRGLIRAAEKFRKQFEVKFSAYAQWWIERYLIEFLAQRGSIAKLPLHRADVFARVQKGRGKLFQILEREPTISEIARALRIDESMVTLAMQHASDPLEFDGTAAGDGEDGGPTIAERLASGDALSPEEQTMARNVKELVEQHLRTLPEREQHVLCHYFGLRKFPTRTLDDIGALMHLTRERVRQIKEQALRTMRASGAFDMLRNR